MDTTQILDVMKQYVELRKPDLHVQHIAGMPVTDVLKSSIDIVDFVLYLEEALGLEEDVVDLDRLGPRITERITFEALVVEVLQYVH